jgi:cytochrome c biogenesis factor
MISVVTVSYLLKEIIVEPEKRPLLRNSTVTTRYSVFSTLSTICYLIYTFLIAIFSVSYLLKERIAEPEIMSVAREQHGKNA